MAEVRPPRIFRITGAAGLLVIAAIGSVALLIEAAVRSGIGNMLLLAPWPLLVLWAIYVVGIASDIRADHTGVQVQNLLRRISVPWSRVKRVGMRWQIELTLDDGTAVRCFGGPVRSKPRRLGPGRTKEDGNAEAGDGVAKLQRLRLDAQSAPDAVVVRTWDWAATLVLAVLVVWAGVAILVTY
ncbi:PH domain-containing protein [Microbacterium sp.]|uniref:PH domain-containing protein n=1 Tax=Microbacterium sp. TaxID=51671 RepID=UPI003F9C2716